MEEFKPNNEKRRVPLIDSYEREKIETSVRDLELTAGTLKAVLDIIDFAEKNNISVKRNNQEFDTLRVPEKDFGPDGKIREALDGLLERARKEQGIIHNQFNDQQKKDWLMFIQDKK